MASKYLVWVLLDDFHFLHETVNAFVTIAMVYQWKEYQLSEFIIIWISIDEAYTFSKHWMSSWIWDKNTEPNNFHKKGDFLYLCSLFSSPSLDLSGSLSLMDNYIKIIGSCSTFRRTCSLDISTTIIAATLNSHREPSRFIIIHTRVCWSVSNHPLF